MTKLEAIKKRIEDATPGPWEYSDNYVHTPSPDGKRECLAEFFGSNPMEGDNSNDTAFIAHSRSDLPWATSWIERAAEQLREWRSQFGASYVAYKHCNDQTDELLSELEEHE